ncbi:hypothetical protein DFH28DRAFT_902979 [Melampsora americana]|nr:hypothetical protein DFH28DRAFT_902979 [Melampsora americana]
MSTLSSFSADTSFHKTSRARHQSVTGNVPYFEAIENLELKDEGCLYRLREKFISHSNPFHVYNQYEDVYFIEDRVAYSRYQRGPVVSRDAGEWIVLRIYIHHREAGGFYFLKYHKSWSDMVSQGRAHCFDRAHSNHYAAMALKEFKRMFFIKRRDEHGRMIGTYQRWHHEANSLSIAPVHPLQSTGALYEGEPRWKICEGVTDRFSHRYVYEYNFNNEPMEYQPWTKLIQTFIHFVYDLSDSKTLISNLDCDEHGVISNVLCFTKNSPPYHSRNSVDMQGVVERAFIHFPDHHDCNELCEHLGNIRLK